MLSLPLLLLAAAHAADLTVGPLTAGESAGARISALDPGARATLLASTRGPGAGPCVDAVCVDVVAPTVVGHAIADAEGNATFRFSVPPDAVDVRVAFQGVVRDAGELTAVQTQLVRKPVVEVDSADADRVIDGGVDNPIGTYLLRVRDVNGADALLATGYQVMWLIRDWTEGGDLDDLPHTRFDGLPPYQKHIEAADLDGDGVTDAVLSSNDSDDHGVWLFHSVPDGTLTRDDATASIHHTDPEARLGWTMAVGDFDGNGVSDVAVCAHGRDYETVYIFTEPFVGEVDESAATMTIDDPACSGVDNVGDLNGDGIDDLAIGDGAYDIFTGYVNVHVSPHDGVPDLIMNGGGRLDTFGHVHRVGDGNGDGVPDLMIGASGAGDVYLIDGTARGEVDPDDVAYAIFDGRPDTGHGATLGDVNGDGIADAVVGSRGKAVYVVYGPLSGRYSVPADADVDISVSDGAGSALALYDVDGDGRLDILDGDWVDDTVKMFLGASF